MNYGLFLSAQGVQSQAFRQDVIANNLANASTTGFKRDLAVFREFLPFDVENQAGTKTPQNLDQHTGGTSIAAVVTDHSTGPLQSTGGDWDVALAGPGFLRVSDGTQEFLTRDGRLDMDPAGFVVTRTHGYRVLGPSGEPIIVDPAAGRVRFAADGTVSQEGVSGSVGTVGLVQPANYLALQKAGRDLYRVSGPVGPVGPDSQIQQGMLEASGVQPVQEMVELIETSRALEANANMIRFQDESLGRLLASLPRR